MNNAFLSNSTRFILLLLLQGMVLCNINFLGFINPYLYILFIILLPVNLGQSKVLLLSFIFGLSLDFFQDSGGAHASACLMIAYLRPVILRFSFGISYEHQTMKFQNTSFGERFQYVVVMVAIHHFVLFSMEIFNPAHILLILKNTLFSGIFSIILILFTMILFGKRKK